MAEAKLPLNKHSREVYTAVETLTGIGAMKAMSEEYKRVLQPKTEEGQEKRPALPLIERIKRFFGAGKKEAPTREEQRKQAEALMSTPGRVEPRFAELLRAADKRQTQGGVAHQADVAKAQAEEQAAAAGQKSDYQAEIIAPMAAEVKRRTAERAVQTQSPMSRLVAARESQQNQSDLRAIVQNDEEELRQ